MQNKRFGLAQVRWDPIFSSQTQASIIPYAPKSLRVWPPLMSIDSLRVQLFWTNYTALQSFFDRSSGPNFGWNQTIARPVLVYFSDPEGRRAPLWPASQPTLPFSAPAFHPAPPAGAGRGHRPSTSLTLGRIPYLKIN